MTPMTPVGGTSRWIAAARALETESPEPIFNDPFARELAGDVGFDFMANTQAVSGGAPGPNPYLSMRTRFLDDSILAAVRGRQYTQIAILAAGMDTRAFRLDWHEAVKLFEVDREDVFAWKEPILARLNAVPRADRRVVRTDLTGDWRSALLSAGFDPARPAAFLLEGLLMYLHHEEVEKLLAALSSIAAKGSWLGLDAVNTELLTSPFTKPFMDKLAELGCGWHFGLSHPESFFTRYGWTATVVLPGERPTQYAPRFKFPVIPRSVPNIPRTLYITATNDEAKPALVGVLLKRFESPDEVRQMVKGKFEIVRLGGMTIGRATYEPGWKWSEHVGAAQGRPRCTVEHVGMVVSGCAVAAFDDGTSVEMRAGQLFYIPPVPHDSWVVGDEPYVSLHFAGADHYAR